MYERILVPVDGSPTSQRGLQEAIRLARLTGARLRLVHAVDVLAFATGFETGAAYTADLVPLMRGTGLRLLEDARRVVAGAGLACDIELLENHAERVCDQIVDEASRWNADLIVIGTHGRRGLDRFFLGSDAELILRHAPVPVLLVRMPVAARDEALQAAAARTAILRDERSRSMPR